MLAPGWVPARDHDNNGYEDNGSYCVGTDVWDSTDEPLCEMDHGQDGGGKYLRVGSVSCRRCLRFLRKRCSVCFASKDQIGTVG